MVPSSSPAASPFSPAASFSSDRLALTRQETPTTPSVGTPIRLAPSTSAFRKGGIASTPIADSRPKPAEGSAGFGASVAGTPQQATPSKGVLGQVSDLIFGW